MSVAARRWARSQKIEDGTLRAVVASVADAADAAGLCELTQAELAERAGLQDRTIRNALGALEALQVIRRSSRKSVGKPGRASDEIRLSLDRDFTIHRDEIASLRKLGVTGTRFRQTQAGGNRNEDVGVTGTVPVTPKPSRVDIDLYSTVEADIDAGTLAEIGRAKAEIFFERDRQKWHGRLVVGSVRMDVGRHESYELAHAACRAAVDDVEHACRSRSGTPRMPVVHPTMHRMRGEDVYRLLNYPFIDRTRTLEESSDDDFNYPG